VAGLVTLVCLSEWTHRRLLPCLAGVAGLVAPVRRSLSSHVLCGACRRTWRRIWQAGAPVGGAWAGPTEHDARDQTSTRPWQSTQPREAGQPSWHDLDSLYRSWACLSSLNLVPWFCCWHGSLPLLAEPFTRLSELESSPLGRKVCDNGSALGKLLSKAQQDKVG
jgi:hypothetical protein